MTLKKDDIKLLSMKTIPIPCYVTEEQQKSLRKIYAETGQAQTETMRKALDEYINKPKIIQSAHEIIDDIIEKDIMSEISQECDVMYSITNYAVLCDNKLLCFAGSDIIVADNLCDAFKRRYPDNEFTITDEFMDFSR